MSVWGYKNLGDLCSLITDGKHGDCRNEDDSGYYFISCKDVKDGQINYENARQIAHDDFDETHRRTNLKPGDVLLTNSGTIGRLAIAPDDERTLRTTFQKSVAILKPSPDKITSHFLYYSLSADQVGLINSAGGAAQKNLLLGELRRFSIKIPSLSVQNEITSILSAYDDLIENNRRRMALLEESARLLYQEWFVRLRFPGHGHTRIVDGVPMGWEKKTLGELATILMGQSPESKYYNEVGDGLPFHQGVTDFGDRFVSNRVYCSLERRIAEPGDILCSVRAPVGRLNLTLDKIVIGRGLAALRSRTDNQSFLFQQLRTHFFKDDIVGSGAIFASVTRKDFEAQELLTPTPTLVGAFEQVSLPIDQQLRVLFLSNQNLRTARDLLLPKLMNGEVAV